MIFSSLQNLLLPFIFAWAIIFGSYFASWYLARKWFPNYLHRKNNKLWYTFSVQSSSALVAVVQFLFFSGVLLTAFLIWGFAFPKNNPIEALFSVKKLIEGIFSF